MSPDARLKAEYGGVKAALEYCVSLGLNKWQSKEFLRIDIKTLRNRAQRYGVTFPDGYATRDMTLTNEVNRKRLVAMNSAGMMGRAKAKRKTQ